MKQSWSNCSHYLRSGTARCFRDVVNHLEGQVGSLHEMVAPA